MEEVISTFSHLKRVIEAEPTAWVRPCGRFYFRVKADSDVRAWMLHCSDNPSLVEHTEESSGADCAIELSRDDFLDLVRGLLNPQQAFLDGRMRVAGELSEVLLVNDIIERFVSSTRQLEPA